MLMIDQRPVSRRHRCGVDDILDADGHAAQQSRTGGPVECLRGGDGTFRVEKRPGADLGFPFLDPLETGADKSLGSDRAIRDASGGFDGSERI